MGLAEEASPDPAERRADPRRKVLLRANVHVITGSADVTVKNVSRSGLMGETDARLKAGQPLIFSVNPRDYHLGVVRWARAGRFGLDLADAVALFGLEDDVDNGFSDDHHPRARRHPVNVRGRIGIGEEPFQATVRDVSQSGLRLETGHQLASGQELIVQIRDRPLIKGTVRWTAMGKAGLKTAERIPILRLVYSVE